MFAFLRLNPLRLLRREKLRPDPPPEEQLIELRTVVDDLQQSLSNSQADVHNLRAQLQKRDEDAMKLRELVAQLRAQHKHVADALAASESARDSLDVQLANEKQEHGVTQQKLTADTAALEARLRTAEAEMAAQSAAAVKLNAALAERELTIVARDNAAKEADHHAAQRLTALQHDKDHLEADVAKLRDHLAHVEIERDRLDAEGAELREELHLAKTELEDWAREMKIMDDAPLDETPSSQEANGAVEMEGNSSASAVAGIDADQDEHIDDGHVSFNQHDNAQLPSDPIAELPADAIVESKETSLEQVTMDAATYEKPDDIAPEHADDELEASVDVAEQQTMDTLSQRKPEDVAQVEEEDSGQVTGNSAEVVSKGDGTKLISDDDAAHKTVSVPAEMASDALAEMNEEEGVQAKEVDAEKMPTHNPTEVKTGDDNPEVVEDATEVAADVFPEPETIDASQIPEASSANVTAHTVADVGSEAVAEMKVEDDVAKNVDAEQISSDTYADVKSDNDPLEKEGATPMDVETGEERKVNNGEQKYPHDEVPEQTDESEQVTIVDAENITMGKVDDNEQGVTNDSALGKKEDDIMANSDPVLVVETNDDPALETNDGIKEASDDAEQKMEVEASPMTPEADGKVG